MKMEATIQVLRLRVEALPEVSLGGEWLSDQRKMETQSPKPHKPKSPKP